MLFSFLPQGPYGWLRSSSTSSATSLCPLQLLREPPSNWQTQDPSPVLLVFLPHSTQEGLLHLDQERPVNGLGGVSLNLSWSPVVIGG